MQRLLIVDDETPIREWIAFVIERSGYPCEIVGLASNGKDALDLVERKNPDILITDIRMPVMDGLELIRRVRAAKHELRIIVLTSYDDFEYARASVKSGVSDYILKTEINESMIIELLARADRENGTPSDDREQSGFNLNLHMNQLLFGQSDATLPITETELERRGIPLKEGSIFAAAVRFDLAPIPDRFDPFLNNHIVYHRKVVNPVWFAYGTDTGIVVANLVEGQSPHMGKKAVDEFVTHIAGGLPVSIGVSGIYEGVGELRKAVARALLSLACEFYEGPGKIYYGYDRLDPTEIEGMLDPLLLEIRKAVTDRAPASPSEAVLNFLRFLEQERPLNVEVVKTTCAGLFDSLYLSSGRTADRPKAAALKTAPDFAAFRASLLELASSFSPGGSRSAYVNAVEKAILYIGSRSLRTTNLAEVAAHVGLNHEYFSRLFKEETGRTFITYLTDLRVRHAKKLLLDSNLKVYEVAEEVGYSNLSYFSRVFKRQEGINPFEFKQRSGLKGEVGKGSGKSNSG